MRFSLLAGTRSLLVFMQHYPRFPKRALLWNRILLPDQKIFGTHIPDDRAVWGHARKTPLPADSEHDLWVLRGTMLRAGELCGSLRSYIDSEHRECRLPAGLVRPQNEHVAYPSDFVMQHVRALFTLTDSRWVMPQSDDPTQPCPPELFSKCIEDRQKPKGKRKTCYLPVPARVSSCLVWVAVGVRRSWRLSHGPRSMQTYERSEIDMQFVISTVQHRITILISRSRQQGDALKPWFAVGRRSPWKIRADEINRHSRVKAMR